MAIDSPIAPIRGWVWPRWPASCRFLAREAKPSAAPCRLAAELSCFDHSAEADIGAPVLS